MSTYVSRTSRRIMPDLRRPADAFRNLGPNWYAVVMGTAIVANAAALLPVDVPALRWVGLGVWILATLLLIVLTVSRGIHLLRHTEAAKGQLSEASVLFYGCPPMAALAVGAGTLSLGKDLIGLHTAVLAA